MAFQEFMIGPTLATSFAQAVQWNAETYLSLKSLIQSKYGKAAIRLGDGDGFAPPIQHPHEALNLLMDAIKNAGHEGKIKISIDPASQSSMQDGEYNMGFNTSEPDLLDASQLGDLYRDLPQAIPDCAA